MGLPCGLGASYIFLLQMLLLLLLANISLAIYACCCFIACHDFISSAFMYVHLYLYFIHTYLNIFVTNLSTLTKLYLYLGVTKFILGVINGNGSKELLRSFLAIHELSLWDSTCIQYPVSVGKKENVRIFLLPKPTLFFFKTSLLASQYVRTMPWLNVD